jgi:chromate transporter
MNDPDQKTVAPKSLSELFWVLSFLALRGFGGVLPWAQRVLVQERNWLSNAEFLELLAYGQILPGPNICNLIIMLGDRHFGWRGALVALTGILLFPIFAVLILFYLYAQFSSIPLVRSALNGMAAVAAGLIIAMGVKLAVTLAREKQGYWRWLIISVCVILGVVVFKWSVAFVLLVLGPIALLLSGLYLSQAKA